ncbi:NAD(P)/FAD-dependent oxidoreductase [Streptacidiphilus sp. P02-A3a]|uniref:protoporphyrinogen/coproporphyrinogen oxidase n=1 Tax=Streptacidiphilus sp. P02-A3a TaxID=2704468 RepID=UPI0015F96371|nr:NAD(P)/FAD-dependent oxidoreductase [Streptacidiphilus sp. P02-A3a]QMU71338.1 FAD-dependent oxidoreductase [Streptacidiphilus sp. P02-A3a]
MSGADLDVAVVGAGISGLAAAYRLREAGRSVRVFEAQHRVGGRMASTRHQGYLLDEGAETIAARGYDATWELIRAMGIAPSEVATIDGGFALWRDGRAHAHLGHPKGLLTGAGMSWRGRLAWLRLALQLGSYQRSFDPDHPERTALRDMTISQFASGRHRDLYDYLLQPLSGHCFGWSPDRSTIAPMLTNLLAVGGVGAQWMTYRAGMDTLARALAERVDVSVGSAVGAVEPEPDGARLHFADGGSLTARQVLLAVPAPIALALHTAPPEDERPYLTASGYTPMLKVACLLDRPLPSPTRSPSYTLSIPGAENRVFAGAILDHVKEPGRVPPGRGLTSLFVAPSACPELLDAPDEQVVAVACAEAERYLPGLRAATTGTFVHRFRYGLPEATPEAVRQRSAFLDRPVRRIEYAGDWVMLRPSSEGAVRSARLAVQRILSHRDAPARLPRGVAAAATTAHGNGYRERDEL